MFTSGPLIPQPGVNLGLYFWAGVHVIVSHAHERWGWKRAEGLGAASEAMSTEREWSWWSSAWTPQQVF